MISAPLTLTPPIPIARTPGNQAEVIAVVRAGVARQGFRQKVNPIESVEFILIRPRCFLVRGCGGASAGLCGGAGGNI
ncbi:hypothetical protein [Kamptonema formosum]|uniref:hypothetical protein n=1 Tax=Kamptonema formosum TaxID=331992 RepID=UPI00034952CB|nr:hypothetical protein [Oscillatoria sp. PCC 10802]